MLEMALMFTGACLMLALAINLFHLVQSKTKPDKILAVDTMYINGLGVIILLGIYFNSAQFFEAGLLIAMLGFISTVALCKYLLRGDIIE
ncbi:K+/H+ antiporter subunit F [bacterium]|nr:K+/H+ antiporter subunit F [bacterium]